MDKNIMRHMTDKMEFEEQEIIEAVTQNRLVGVLMSLSQIFEKNWYRLVCVRTSAICQQAGNAGCV